MAYEELYIHSVDFSYHTPYTVIDARRKSVFEGGEEERLDFADSIGFIPAAVNMPLDTFTENGLFMEKEKLLQYFEDKSVAHDRQICTMASIIPLFSSLTKKILELKQQS